MKTNKKGKIVLQRGDYRTGNFVFHEENSFIKVMATSGIVSWRILADSAIGQMVRLAIKDKLDGWLSTYAAMNFSQLMVVPDAPFFSKHAELINFQTLAHPEFYGKSAEPVSKEEDDKIIAEEKELQEAVENTAK